MVRNDGKWEIYRIQHKWNNKKNKWVYSIENEEFFKSSEECWQLTGINGTFNFDEAREAYGKVVSRLEKERKFRLVKLIITQKTVVL